MPVLLRDRVPAYIPWDRFEANQARLTANRSGPDTPGAPRAGAALLGGLVRCGRCGRRMNVCYGGARARPSSNRPPWRRAWRRSSRSGRPWSGSGGCGGSGRGTRRAGRQYQACEPVLRLVARELERRWEQALADQRRLDDEYERWQRAAPVRMAAADERAIRSLAADLPAVWHAPTTTPADRQRVARLLLGRVVVRVDRASERVDAELHWLGGLVRTHVITRPVTRYECQADYPRLVERLRALCGDGLRAAAVADRLNAEGFRPPRRGNRFKPAIVLWLMAKVGLPRRERYGSTTGLGPDEYRPMGLARRLGVPRDAVRRWIGSGYVTTRADADGHRVIWADAAELRRLRALSRASKTGADKSRLAELRTPRLRAGW